MKASAMHRRLLAEAACISLIALPLWLATAAGQTLDPAAAASADATHGPPHGLLGHYYTRDLPGSYDLKGFLVDEYGIPVPNKQPNAIRQDAQIAFGKGQGFVPAAGESQLVWWTPAEARAVVWKGYIRLPVAGTYYLTTASSGASAVYLGSARVSLNGGFGGSVPSTQFSLGETGTDAASSPMHWQYVVPIPVSGPRVLPIEVRYLIHDSKGAPRGIDLYWIRPDAPRDPSGKAAAQIVPAEVLFTTPPEPVDKPKVRGANGMISSDFLYLSAEPGSDVPGSEATVTVRLADERGRPVAGHRVHVSTLQRRDGGSSPDEIVQPPQPTDENGIATARLRATGYGQHGAQLFATDVTDLVDVAQVAEVFFERRQEWSLRPPGFAPYYDSKAMTVEPLPLRVGQPTTLTVLLANRTRETADVTAAFHARETNIGGVKWDAIGKVERTLAPGESGKLSITWTPQKPDPHLCFKVDMSATFRTVKASPAPAAQVLALAGGSYMLAANAASPPTTESLQRNIGPVVGWSRCESALSSDVLDEYHFPYQHPSDGYEGEAEYAQRTVPAYRACAAAASQEIGRLNAAAASAAGASLALISQQLQKAWDKFDACTYWANCHEYSGQVETAIARGDRTICVDQAKRTAQALQDLYRQFEACVEQRKGPAPYSPECDWTGDPDQLKFFNDRFAELKADLAKWQACASDPPDAEYRQLAVAASDTVAAYVQAMTTSMERLQGAQAAGDQEWMAKQTTAKRLYQKRIADAFRTRANELRARAEKLPPDDPADVERSRVAHARFIERLRSGNPQPAEDQKALNDTGLTQVDIERANVALLAAKVLPPVRGPRENLIALADSAQRSADALEQFLAQPPEGRAEGQPGEPLLNTFIVGNPNDTPATIDLRIRRIALPESWQLSIIDAPGPADRNAQPGAPKPTVTEVTAGVLYQVTLPPKTEVRVASVVVPVGETGVNTTARWAVEGRIGNELLGGVVHEMYVPVVLADLQLPPIAGSATGVPPLVWLAAAISVLLVGILLLEWRRMRSRA